MRVVRSWAWRRSVECATLVLLVLALGVAGAQAAPFVYVTNAGGGGGPPGNLSQYDATAGLLAPLVPPTVAVGNSPLGVAVSPDARSVYVTAVVASAQPAPILQFSVGADGALTLRSSAEVPFGLGPGQLAVSPDGRSVYVINTGGRVGVIQYSVGPGGALTLKSPPIVQGPDTPTRLAVSPDGRNVYVTNSFGSNSTVSQYSVRADGTLSPKSPPTVPTSQSPVGLAVSPDGRSVYVAEPEETGVSGLVAQYTVGPDGTLSPESPPTVPAPGGPFEVAVSPNGTSVYVTSDSGGDPGTVLQYTVGANGTLTPKSPAAVRAGRVPLGIAINPDGKTVYAANAGDGTVSQYAVGSDGRLSAGSPAVVTAGNNPVEIAVSPPARVPTSKDQCKNGGWRRYPGFKNQGDCVSVVATGGKNPPGTP